MENFHTIIIGAGPAGLSCATILAKQGHNVLVLERKKTIGQKVCAGGIPYHALQHLNLPQDLLEISFPIQHIVTPCQKTKISSALPIISTINRQILGQFMATRATSAGATIKTGTSVTSITSSSVQCKEKTYTFKYLVGADGSSSIVRRFLNIPTTSVGVGIHYRIPGHFSKMEWHFDPRKFGSGYAWIFPHKKIASIGAYAERQEIPPKLLQKRLDAWATKQGISVNNIAPSAALINFDYRGWRFKNIFLTGDAAGLASGVTGEGILPATISGIATAKTILDPCYKDRDFMRLIVKQQRHRNMQKILASNKVICHLALEMLVLGLKTKIIPFKHLEMS